MRRQRTFFGDAHDGHAVPLDGVEQERHVGHLQESVTHAKQATESVPQTQVSQQEARRRRRRAKEERKKNERTKLKARGTVCCRACG
jgi:hypothetical protein